ncbi:MAG: hypothetical protein IJR82_03450 [Bacilli bacterium]|nr:hypothetical protein [Bacilli bacterium]
MKQKKNLMILLLIAVIGIVGVTVAYFSSTTTFENVFETPEYGTQYIEKFTSPDNWLPGDVTEKTLEVKNSGSVDEAARVKVEESWVSKRGTTLPLTQGDNIAALINFINEDDWTKVTVDGENYYYYYYNYKLAPEETTSKLLDKVTFNPLINASITCTDSTGENGETIRSCTSNGNGYDGATYTLKFTIETVQYDKYQEAWNVDVAIAEEKPHPGTLTLLEKTNPVSITNYADGNIHEMYTFEHEATAQTPALTDYRYIGNDPYNYVYFNCDSLDNQNGETCEVWRILGVFDVEREVDDEDNPGEKKIITETRMKLVRGTRLDDDMSWDDKGTWGYNDWTTSSLNIFLNNDYLYKRDGAELYGLTESAREMVNSSKYYLGSKGHTSMTAEELYSIERGDILCRDCGVDTTKITWNGIVALMYPSDQYISYKGVNDACYNNPFDMGVCRTPSGWVFKDNNSLNGLWFITPSSSSSGRAFLSWQTGSLIADGGSYYSTIGKRAIRPVVYLSADVKIIDGTGQSTDPYKLK